MAHGNRNRICVQSENPIRCKHLQVYSRLFKVLENQGQMLLHQLIDHRNVLIETWDPNLVNITHFKVLDQRHEKPKRNFFGAVLHQSVNDVVHALDVANSVIVFTKG